jgi:hypothetical protein
MELISSRSNPKIKQVRALRQRKARQKAACSWSKASGMGEAVEATRRAGSITPRSA